MRERPILFSAPMVRALLAGTKTQTRRPVKPQPDWLPEVSSTRGTDGIFWPLGSLGQQCGAPILACPYGVPGDRLWVRESFSGLWGLRNLPPREWPPGTPLWYWADGDPTEGDWTRPKPGMFMPRWGSRLLLEITEVRVERLNACSEADALAEGIIEYEADREENGDPAEYAWDEVRGRGEIFPSAASAYADLWRHINGPGSWAANPWVWAVSFQRVAA